MLSALGSGHIGLRGPAAARLSGPPHLKREPADRFTPGPPPPPSPGDAFEDLEAMCKIPGFNFVFGHMAVAVDHCARAWNWLKRKWKGNPPAAGPKPPLAYQLAEHRPARLDRPVIFVPGFNMKPDCFSHLTRKLTENGANGAVTYFVRDGGFYEDFACEKPCQVAPGDRARVFVASFHTTGQPPDLTAPQLDADLRAICAATGQTRVDAVGYSMGGLATRVYLDQGGERVGRFAMLCTPNQGSALAKISQWLLEIEREGRDVKGLLNWKGLRQQDAPALHWLRPTNGGSPNFHLLDLNRRWPGQLNRVESAVVLGSASHQKTYSTYLWPLKGDGTVTAGSLQLPGLPRKLFTTPDRGTHAEMPFKPEVYDFLHEFFAWGGQTRS